jgi:hypothetical protein
MYLFACRIKVRMKYLFTTFNHKILNLTILTLCKKNLSQSDCIDQKIIIYERKRKVLWMGESRLMSIL